MARALAHENPGLSQRVNEGNSRRQLTIFHITRTRRLYRADT